MNLLTFWVRPSTMFSLTSRNTTGLLHTLFLLILIFIYNSCQTRAAFMLQTFTYFYVPNETLSLMSVSGKQFPWRMSSLALGSLLWRLWEMPKGCGCFSKQQKVLHCTCVSLPFALVNHSNDESEYKPLHALLGNKFYNGYTCILIVPAMEFIALFIGASKKEHLNCVKLYYSNDWNAGTYFTN